MYVIIYGVINREVPPLDKINFKNTLYTESSSRTSVWNYNNVGKETLYEKI